ncbi:hypothetical protein FC35_GL000149 [Limosilactobacillus coleohominis DSM 14060]|nr:hypothetical protein FC35_GL000149 [Limosilactobacillus coleohominis DSM 14060]
MYAGEVAYKQGDWDIAEKWWLSVLDIRPTNVTHKLEIMYRKQKRYKDIVDMYSLAAKHAAYYAKLTGQNMTKEIVSSRNLAGEELLNNLENDKSRGVIEYPTMINKKFINRLQEVAGSNK